MRRAINWHKYQIIPFLDGGRGLDGVDCWGLIYLVYQQEFRVVLPTYGWIGASELRAVYDQIDADKDLGPWMAVESESETLGDVVVMTGTIKENGALRMAPVHVGMVTAPGTLMHTEAHTGCTIMRFRDTADGRANPLLMHRVKGIYRHGHINERL